jgi:outer membrane protein assembly factor BamB
MNRRTALQLLSGVAPLALAPVTGSAAGTRSDWPQWRGPARDGRSTETGLLKSWPQNGPQTVWTTGDLGSGYGSVSLVADSLYLHGGVSGKSVVHAIDRATGRKKWTTQLGRTLDQDRGPGPRGTPTYENGRLYVLSEDGELACINAADGKKIWQKNILTGFGGSNAHWLLSESPLIEGDLVIVQPGGRDAAVVAIDKNTGQPKWTSQGLSDPAGYASCIAATVGNVRVILTLTAKAGVGVRASDGKPMFRFDEPANRTANCTTPVFHNNRVFFTSAYGTGAQLVELEASGGEIKAKEVYFSRDMMNHHGGVILHEGHIYGFSNAILTCMDFNTGAVKWRDRSVGKGSLTYADGHLYLLGERYVMGLAEASPEAYKEKSRFSIQDLGLPSWSHPVVAQGCLYIRNQATLTCYNILA